VKEESPTKAEEKKDKSPVKAEEKKDMTKEEKA